jgi:TPR repeat protein
MDMSTHVVGKMQLSMIEKLNQEERSRKAYDLYFSGNMPEAFSSYMELAKEGYVASQRFVGWLYFRGEGVAKDNDKALFWFNQAAASEDSEAMFGIGRVFMERGDYQAAFSWFEKSSGKDFLPAAYWVARFLRDGIGIEADKAKAFEIFKQTAVLGHLQSLREYALMLLGEDAGLVSKAKGVFLLGKLFVLSVIIGLKDTRDLRGMI